MPTKAVVYISSDFYMQERSSYGNETKKRQSIAKQNILLDEKQTICNIY